MWLDRAIPRGMQGPGQISPCRLGVPTLHWWLGRRDGSGQVLGRLLLLAVASTYHGAMVGHSATAAQGSGWYWGLAAPKRDS